MTDASDTDTDVAATAHRAADPRFAPPVAHVADAPDPSGLVLGGRWRRFWAAAIDGLLQAALGLPVAFALAGSMAALQSAGWRMILMALYVVVFVAANGWLLSRHGQTVGKRLLGLRIVRPDGSRATLGRLLVRRQLPIYVANLLPLLGALYGLLDGLFIFGARRRMIHDLLADTIVVTAGSSA